MIHKLWIVFRDLGVNQSKNDIEEMVAKFSKVKYSEVTDIDSFSDFETEKKKIQPKEQSHSLLKWKEFILWALHGSEYWLMDDNNDS